MEAYAGVLYCALRDRCYQSVTVVSSCDVRHPCEGGFSCRMWCCVKWLTGLRTVCKAVSICSSGNVPHLLLLRVVML